MSGRRQKRGIFNFVGEISKILFGTLDDADAAYYKTHIDRMEARSEQLSKLSKEQVAVARATLTVSAIVHAQKGILGPHIVNPVQIVQNLRLIQDDLRDGTPSKWVFKGIHEQQEGEPSQKLKRAQADEARQHREGSSRY
ncbi:uncharacterized protein LOC124623110 [Schistocerca americana]|uniref:uncharacterized protein LOC124623110 n=1 Tax=Schistocerca americana TaxID=7009 RepID=UPI001F50235C|nr:uncharacterized protein LOC124623110 [Schistocerca americana]